MLKKIFIFIMIVGLMTVNLCAQENTDGFDKKQSESIKKHKKLIEELNKHSEKIEYYAGSEIDENGNLIVYWADNTKSLSQSFSVGNNVSYVEVKHSLNELKNASKKLSKQILGKQGEHSIGINISDNVINVYVNVLNVEKTKNILNVVGSEDLINIIESHPTKESFEILRRLPSVEGMK